MKNTTMRPQLFQAHFQLTRRCNLACEFCGQHRGLIGCVKDDIRLDEWLAVAGEVQAMASETGAVPEITLWGGEPLLYPFFDELAENLHAGGFRLNLVTNGGLLDRHLASVAECIDHLFVSLDGPQEIHDSIRGAGVFARVAENLGKLNPARRGRLTFLTTLADGNVAQAAQLPLALAFLHPDEVVLQPMMYLTAEEIQKYRDFSRREFQSDYAELLGWRRDEDWEYLAALQAALREVEHTPYPFPVLYTPHRYPQMASSGACEAPWTRVHIRCDGAVGFCTDYFGFSAGNIRQQSLRAIFLGERAESFRQAVLDCALPTCDHCPWHRQHLLPCQNSFVKQTKVTA